MNNLAVVTEDGKEKRKAFKELSKLMRTNSDNANEEDLVVFSTYF